MTRNMLAVTLALLIAPLARASPDPADRHTRVRELASSIVERALASPDPASDSVADADALLLRVVADADPPRDRATIIAAARASRFARLLRAHRHPIERNAIDALLAHDELAHELLFAIDFDHDDPNAVLRTLGRLVHAHGARRVASAPRLVAAICVVHDEPMPFVIEEIVAEPAPPEDVFAYFTDGRTLRPFVRELPPGLLVWMVETVGIDDLAWAHDRYERVVGLQPAYDSVIFDHEHTFGATVGTRPAKVASRVGGNVCGTPRPRTLAHVGHTLPNIKLYGGTNADRAHFALQAGRATGTPAALMREDVAKRTVTWVAALAEQTSGAPLWDFNAARNWRTEHLHGVTEDPQRRTEIDAARLEGIGASFGAPTRDRHLATAFVDAARLLDGQPAEQRLDPLERAIDAHAPCLAAWDLVAALASRGELTREHLNTRAERAFEVFGEDHAAFALDFARSLARTVVDPDEQIATLERLYLRSAPTRAKLAAELLLEIGELHELRDHPAPAIESYALLAERHVKDSSRAVTGFERALGLLVDTGGPARADAVGRRVWPLAETPSYWPEYARVGNRTQMGFAYARLLRRIGQHNHARAIERSSVAHTWTPCKEGLLPPWWRMR